MPRRPSRAAATLLAAALFAVPLPGHGQRPAADAAPDSAATLLDVPFLPQSEALCGGAAAAMVLRYWGETEVRPEDFADLVRADEGGIRTGELVEALDDRGWRAVPFQGSPEEVRRQLDRGRPVIALIEDRPGRYHYVVLVAWTDRGVILHDPARAPFRVFSPRQVAEAWAPADRWALLVLPAEEGGEPGLLDPGALPPGDPPAPRVRPAPADSAAAPRVPPAAPDTVRLPSVLPARSDTVRVPSLPPAGPDTAAASPSHPAPTDTGAASVPPPPGDTAATPSISPAPGDAAAAPPLPPAPGDATAGGPEGVCASGVTRAVALARTGALEEADSLLSGLRERCPDPAPAVTELAGLRARQGRWREARILAGEAARLRPDDPWVWRVLATSRFLTDDPLGALAAWNRVGEPTVDLVHVQGLERTRQATVEARLGLRAGEVLTPGALVRARRRLELLPAAAVTRTDYRPRNGGRADVEAAVLERPLVPSSLPAFAGLAVRGAVLEETALPVSSPFGGGTLWRLHGRWEHRRPAAGLAVRIPDPPLLPGVLVVEGGWERQTYRAPGEGSAGDGGISLLEEERRWAGLGLTDWLTGRLRWEVGAALERRDDGRSDASVRGSLELRGRDDRLSLEVGGRAGRGVERAAGDRSWGVAAADAHWRSSAVPSGPVLVVRGGFEAASPRAPLSAWPGAGTGRARDHLLRGHPLLDDGVITGPAFGRTLFHGGVEGTWWSRPTVPVALGLAAFVDGVRARHGLYATPDRVEVDGGVGLRASFPGGVGALRADLARGLRGGADWVFRLSWGSVQP